MEKEQLRVHIRGLIFEFITKKQLDKVEDFADDMFRDLNIDIEFTNHFIQRLNDPRNNPEITTQELIDLFTKTYNKYGQKIPNFRDGTHAVVTDLNSNINIPFEFAYNKETKMWEFRNMTVMRKKDFKTPDMKLKV